MIHVTFSASIDLQKGSLRVREDELEVEAEVEESDAGLGFYGAARVLRVSRPCDPRHNRPEVDLTSHVPEEERARLESMACFAAEDQGRAIDRYEDELRGWYQAS